MLITIDPYYNVEFYNKCIQALINNKVPVKQFISPISKKWYLDVPVLPIMLNYDLVPENEKRFLLSKTIAVQPQEQYLLYRRTGDTNVLNPVMVKADYMTQDTQYALFFNLKNRQDGNNLSKVFKTKIYYLGKYYYNKYRLCVCFDEGIKTLISASDIVYEKTPSTTWMKAEQDINQKVFLLRDYLVKFTQTPYFDGSKFVCPNYYGELQKRFFSF